MPIHHAILALLAQGPSHGYQLKRAFDAAVGPQWGALNIGHLYQVLDRLARDEHVRFIRISQDVRPDRVVYDITPSGREELARWMATPSPRTAGFRDDFYLKLVAAARGRDPAPVEQVLRTQRAFLLRELHNLEDLGATHATDPVVALLLSAAVRHIGADLAFLDDAETRLLADGALDAGTRTAAPAPAEPERRTT